MNLTAIVQPPLLSTGGTATAVYDNLFDYQTTRYDQSKAATIGYDSMNMDIIVSEAEVRDWLTNGIGRHIEIYATSGRVWEGFVNQINLTIANTTLNIGPLLDISNSIRVDYTTRRWDTNPPIGGDPASTAFAQNDPSVNRWGTFEEVISGGEGVAATMLAMRNSKLNELAWPRVSQDLSSGTSGQGVLSLSCLGYYHMLNRYLFTANTGDTGEVNISNKLEDVLADDPDTLFAATNAVVEANTLQVPSFDDGSRTGLSVIQELVGLGFASGQRAMFQVGNNRRVVYKALPLDMEAKYVYGMYDNYPLLALRDGTTVKPWDIQVGEWIEIESLAAKPIDSDLPRHSDPRFIFIESVSFTAPDDISIQGGIGNTLKEKIAERTGTGYRAG